MIWFRRRVRVDPQTLFGRLFAEWPALSVGWNDEPIELRVARPDALRDRLRDAMVAFAEHWGGSPGIADVHVVAMHRRLDVRIAPGSGELRPYDAEADRRRQVRACLHLDPWVDALGRELARSGGKAHRGRSSM